MESSHNFQYSSLPINEDYGNGKQFDRRFDYTPKSFDKIPWKSTTHALFLPFLPSIFLFLSYFILARHMEGERSQAYGQLALGILTFLPGAKGYYFAQFSA
ncbi:hypothetical protein UlMin_028154 [Ulmus minor]